jgi:hypothetical protein
MKYKSNFKFLILYSEYVQLLLASPAGKLPEISWWTQKRKLKQEFPLIY